jgi:cobyrinic acid a,c-diamide synthase
MECEKVIPRLLIAGTDSGCGKTTISMGLMAALMKKGYKVQSFKVGADYVDPMFHSYITGKPSNNLDGWMLNQDTIKYLYQKNIKNADIAVIEGVMGLFDGFLDTTERGSTLHISKILNMPVILVANGDGMALGIIALLKEYIKHRNDTDIRGIILNNIDDKKYFQYLKKVIETNIGTKVIGHVPKMDRINISTREFELMDESDIKNLQKKIDILADKMLETLDFDFIIKTAKDVKDNKFNKKIEEELQPVIDKKEKRPLIAVPRDRAFRFYYKDNLDLLETYGANLRFFDTFTSNELPEGTDALYIGGGHIELYLNEISGNINLSEDIKRAVNNDMPCFAESDGFIFLTDKFIDKRKNKYCMAGVFNIESIMESRVQRYGYIEIEAKQDNILIRKNDFLRGHECSYISLKLKENHKTVFNITRKRVCEDTYKNCGFAYKNAIGGYQHIHFWSNINSAKNLVKAAKEYQENNK